MHQLIALGGHALALEAKRFSGVGAGGNSERHRPPWRWNLDASPVYRLRQRDVQIHVHVLAVAPEEGVRTHVELDQSVAGGPALNAWAALALQPQNLSAFDAGRNGDIERTPLGQ